MPQLVSPVLPLVFLLFAIPACGGPEAPQSDVQTGVPTTKPPVASGQTTVGQEEAMEAQEPAVDVTAPALLEVSTFLEGKPIGKVHFDVQWNDEGKPSKTSSMTEERGVRTITFDHGSQLLRLIFYSSAYTAPQSVEDKSLLLGGRTHKIRVDLDRGGIVSGVVWDVEGNPLAGADVIAFFETPESLDQKESPTVRAFSKTNEEGRFRLGGFPAGPFVLEAAIEGQSAVWRPGGVLKKAQELDGLEIQLEPAHTVYGQVLDSEENPIAGALVVAGKPNRRRNRRPTQNPQVYLYNARSRVTRSAEDGTFQLPGVPDSQRWMVHVTHPEYKKRIVGLDPGQQDLWVQLEQGLHIRGQVQDEEGLLVPKVQIWMLTSDGEPSTFTDLHGAYAFGGLDPRERVYLIYYRPAVGTAFVGPISLQENQDNVDVVLDSSLVVEGVIQDAQGNPVVGASLRIQGQVPEDGFPSFRLPERFLRIDAVQSGEDGVFRFEELYTNTFSITASAPGHEKISVDGVTPGADALQIQFRD